MSALQTRLAPAFALLDACRIPAVAASVVTRQGERAEFRCGVANRLSGEALTPAHQFDLASLTKVLVTLPEVLALLSEGRLGLETRVGDVLPEAGWMQSSGLKTQTVRALLSHAAGLRAWTPLYLYPADRSTLIQRVLQEAGVWTGEPGPLYSDLGFMVLGAVVERLRGQRLDQLAAKRSALTFNPAGPSVATETDPWRGRTLQGEVHDENAWAMQGVSGHAGAFGTLAAVTDLVEQYLNETLLPPEVLRLARQEFAADADVRRGLGWQLWTPDGFGGSLASPGGYGHTGFTGTSVWTEPERGYAITLLTNRVHPTRHGTASEIVALRREFHDAVHPLMAK
ncbi:serine hydrolase domain-containing protein [Deinococcus alpinitundrae]|uniref:serine hydrolase domain-containing protein n=1 Tax=Deinococcus alpinitundrae TaxID=468913 RepID=UPI00137AC4AC|nr:serine hydrolase domain-containing protein [Deinococcus alpinitundrae]